MRRITKLDLLNRKLELYNLFCRGCPSLDVLAENNLQLQEWVLDNLRSEFDYATGISIMDAVDDISMSQIENGLEELE